MEIFGGIIQTFSFLVYISYAMMSENIELHCFSINTVNETDIEEYDEINHSAVHEEFSPKYSTKTLKEFDFFTQYDVEITQKGSKKRKNIKKERSSNIMDMVASELAAVKVPIVENVIEMSECTKEQRNSCLEQVSTLETIFQRCFSDHEWSRKGKTLKLSPTFPRVLENAAVQECDIPVQYVEPYQFNDLIISNQTDTKQAKFLDITIQNVNFKHHHQFSLEELLCVKLLEIYKEYNFTVILLKDLWKEIKVNRETRDSLKRELTKISPRKEDVRFDKTLRNYTAKLLLVKEKYTEEIKKERVLVHKIMSLWSDIELVRDKVGYIKTPYVLEITKNTLNDNDFEREWNDAFNLEFNDKLDVLEYDYVTKYIEYRELKYEQKSDMHTKVKISRPKLKIDEEELKEQVEEIVNNTVQQDKIAIVLKQDDNIVSDSRKSGKSILKFNLCFKIYVDNVFVCESEGYSSKSNKIFDIDFFESLSVEILSHNSVLAIVLTENDEETSCLRINLNDIRKVNASTGFSLQKFVYNRIVEPNSKHVGSGHNIKEIAAQCKVRLKSSNLFKGNLYTTCEVKLRVGWNQKLNQNHSAMVKLSMGIGRKLQRLLHGVDKPNIDMLRDIIGKVYGKDIGNDVKILDSLGDLCKMDTEADDTFPLDENSPEFIRLKLLHLRNTGRFLNIEDKLIPLHASQISTEQLNCLQKSEDNDFDVHYYNDKYTEMDPIELQRFIGSNFVQKLNKNMLKNLNEHLLKKTHKDVVRDFKDLSLRNIFSNQTNLATLAAVSSSTKQQLLNDSLTKEQEIQVTVLRAFNLLDRRATIITEEDDDDDERIAGFKVRPLRPFVRVSYRGVNVQTAPGIGCQPTWNQTVKIKIRPEPLSSIHINVYDEHRVNISDGYPEDDQSFHSKTVHYRYYNKWMGTLQVPLRTVLEMGTLRGTFKITTPPLLLGYENPSKSRESTRSLIPEVTQLMRKETAFISLQLTTNLSHLGGLNGYHQPVPSNPEDDDLIRHLNNFVTNHINDFPSRNISLTLIDSCGRNRCVTEFLQPIPPPEYECFPKNPKSRSESAASKCSAFSKSTSSKSSMRKDVDLEKASPVYNEEKESVYSASDGWRSGETQLVKSVNACLRYVSLIPTYEVAGTHVVSLLGVELLKVLHGSPLDHSILLASYFIYMGVQCWIVVGLGLPRGRSSYVLTKYDLTTHKMVLIGDRDRSKRFLGGSDGYAWYLYDATCGEKYELRDVSCPLKTVDYVFDNENIWVNVQSSQDCESVSFNFSRSSDWRPVFDKILFTMKQPISSDASLYSAPVDVERLRHALETKIKSKIQKWRSHMKTIWNRYCGSLLREILPQWEYWAFNPTEPKPGLSQRLKQLLITYKMFGFPLNVPYANTKSVVSTVKSTAIHISDDPNVEFGLGVEVFPYPSNVLSVWVFLTSITRV